MTPVCEPAVPLAPDSRTGWFTTRTQIAMAACVCAGASAFVYAVNPNHHAIYPQCMLYNATGIYCVGCGATRAIYALLHGRVLEALHDNALVIASLPLLLFVVGSYLMKAWQLNAWPQVMVDQRSLKLRSICLLLLMFSFMLLRNLSGWPFDWLKPLSN